MLQLKVWRIACKMAACIRLRGPKFELTSQDVDGVKTFTVLTSM